MVEIEKSRKSLGWTGSVTLTSIFADSTVLQDAIGGDMSDIIIALAFKDVDVDYPKTWGGKVWWKTISEKKGYRIQQNIFSRHYRRLDQEHRRIYASFSVEEIKTVLDEIFKS